MKSEFYKLYVDHVAPTLKQKHGYKNVNEIPKIEKIVINVSVASAPDVKAALEAAVDDLQRITGQKPVQTLAKKSVSNFKLRKGQQIGAKVTLRGDRMYEFLERLVVAALPRIRDFRGISPKAFDGNGNYTLGVKEQSIFPEIELDKIKRLTGFDITFVTTARTDAEAKSLLSELGMPFSDKKKTTSAPTNV